MIHDPLTVPAHASPPDTDRDGTTASAAIPEWVVHLLACVIRFLLQHGLAARSRRGLPAWWDHRPDLAAGSVEQLAAWRRGAFGNAIAWTCRRRGIGPGHKDWPEIARAIVAYGGSIEGFRPGMAPCGLQWWENPNIVPGMLGETPATPAADALATLLSQPQAATAPWPFAAAAPRRFAAHAANGNDAAPAPRRTATSCPATSCPATSCATTSCAAAAPPTGPPQWPRWPTPAFRTNPAPTRPAAPVHAAHNVAYS